MSLWTDEEDVELNKMNQKTNFISSTEPPLEETYVGMHWFNPSINKLYIRN